MEKMVLPWQFSILCIKGEFKLKSLSQNKILFLEANHSQDFLLAGPPFRSLHLSHLDYSRRPII